METMEVESHEEARTGFEAQPRKNATDGIEEI